MEEVTSQYEPIRVGKPISRVIGRIVVTKCIAPDVIFGRLSVRISAGTSAVLTEVSHRIPQSLQTISGIVPRLDCDRIFENNFHFNSLLNVRRYTESVGIQ
jgi:hypothetical protein